MPHIFISYAKKDTRRLAETLYEALNTLPGVTAWMDRSLEADRSWAAQIGQEIDRADYVVVLLSPDVNRPETATQRRSFVLNEIDYAQDDNKPILPVLVQKTRMPVQLAGVQYIDLTARPDDPGPVIQRIVQRFGVMNPHDLPSARSAPARTGRIPGRLLGVGSLIVVAGIAVLALVSANLNDAEGLATPSLAVVAEVDGTAEDATATPTATHTSTATSTNTSTATPTATYTSTATSTNISTPTPSATTGATRIDTTDGQPTETPRPTLTPLPAYPCAGQIVMTSGGLLNQVHVSPINSSPRRQGVQQGSAVQLLAEQTNEGRRWYQIRYNNDSMTGWILTDYVITGAQCPP